MNESLLILKVDLIRNFSSPQVEYKVYDKKGKELSLESCKDLKIGIFYPVNSFMIENIDTINEFKNLGIDLYNKEDSFFNDRCNNQEFNNSDIPISLRRKLLFENQSLCEENCDYEEFDLNNDKVKCNCDVKNNMNLNVNNEIYIDNFGESVISNLNYDIIFCYDKLFDIKNYMNNYGYFFSVELLFFNFIFNFINFFVV